MRESFLPRGVPLRRFAAACPACVACVVVFISCRIFMFGLELCEPKKSSLSPLASLSSSPTEKKDKEEENEEKEEDQKQD